MTTLDRRAALKVLVGGAGAVALGGAMSLSGASTVSAEPPQSAAADCTLSETIARYIVEARFADLPAASIHSAKAQLAFFLSRCLEISATEHSSEMRRAISPPYQTVECVTVIGDPLRLAVADAAWANALLFAGPLPREDTGACEEIQPGVLTLPGALALGEANRVSGRDLILALVLGYEVLGKFKRAALQWQGSLPCHATRIFSGFGPVTVAGRLMRLDRARMTHAVSAGGHLSLSVAENPMLHHYYAQIARQGTHAALRVANGALRYSRSALDGEYGLYSSLLPRGAASLTKRVEPLGYEEIIAAASPRGRAREHWLAARGSNLISREQLERVLNLIDRLEQVNDVSVLLGAIRR